MVDLSLYASGFVFFQIRENMVVESILDKPACLIIILQFGFSSDSICQTQLEYHQIVLSSPFCKMDIHSIYFLAATSILCIQKEFFSSADWDFTTFSQAAKAQHQRTACRLLSSNNLLFQYPSSQNFNLPNPLHSLASSIT